MLGVADAVTAATWPMVQDCDPSTNRMCVSDSPIPAGGHCKSATNSTRYCDVPSAVNADAVTMVSADPTDVAVMLLFDVI